MASYKDTLINTVTDGPGVSSLATVEVDWHAGGALGLAFNATGAGVCFLTRFLAERGYVFNPKTPMLVQALFTASAGVVTYHNTGFSPETLILAGAVLGNVFSTLQEESVRAGIKNIFSRTVDKIGLSRRQPSSQQHAPSRARKAFRIAALVVTEPNVYWTAALTKAVQSLLAAPLFLLGGGISFFQPIFQKRAENFLSSAEQKREDLNNKFIAAKTGIYSRAAQRTWFGIKNKSAQVINKKEIGLKLFAWACAFGVGQNLFFADNPRIALASAFYGLTALSIYAYNVHHGVAQALRHSRQRRNDYACALC